MATYRLVWSGSGALDLSQVLDTRGRPIVLSPQQREVSVVGDVLKNPYLQRYLSTPQLKAELLDGPQQPTPSPAPQPPMLPPTTPPIVKAIPVTPIVTPQPVIPFEEVMTKETLTDRTSSAEPPSSSTPPASADTEAKTESKGGSIKGKGGRK